MAENETAETPAEDTATVTDDKATETPAETLGDAGRKAIQEERAKAKAALARAKAVEAELAELRKASMTETEKATAEAEQRGRQAAMSEFGQRLVRAEFRAAAGGRVDKIDELLDDLNLARFVDDDGEPDAKAIKRAVSRWLPAAPADDARTPGPRPDLSQGGSRTQMALNSDELTESLRAAVGA